MKKLVIAFICLLVVAPCIAENTPNNHNNDGYENSQLANAASAGYVPNQIIVKFRRNITNTIETRLAKGETVEKIGLSNSLDKLNKKYRIRETEPVFKDFRKQRQRIKTLRQKNKALLTKREKRILRRLRRAPKGARVPELDRIYKIEVELEPGQSLEEVAAAYNDDPDVEYAGLNHVVSIDAIPNDPLYPYQWALNNTGQMYLESGSYNSPPGTAACDIGAQQAWDVSTGDTEIIVAVLDTGVDFYHRDLENNMWFSDAEYTGPPGMDDDGNGYVDDIFGGCAPWIHPTYLYVDDNGHGTHCAGIIGAVGNNGLDVTGVGWGVTVLNVTCLDSDGYGYFTHTVWAINYAVATGADVISMSFGGDGFNQLEQDAIDYAYSQGVIVVASAGNDNINSEHYPASYDHVVSVAATNSNDQKASFSNYGNWIDIAAPGVDILSLRADGTSRGTVYDEYTTIMSGTSMSCPYVSGVIALMLSSQPTLSVDQATAWLLATADDISAKNPGYEGLLGSGRANVSNAVRNSFINLNADVYSCDDTVSIQLGDIDLMGQNSQQITVTTNAGDQESLMLTIQDINKPGVFAGAIDTSAGSFVAGNGVLEVSHGETITVTYNDADDGTGSSATVEAFATVDCQSPVVSNVQITDISCTSAKMTFETDEPATTSIYCGLACGGSYTITDNNSTLNTSHTFYLAGLVSQTDYYFMIDAIDAAGNQITDSNGGECYSFATKSPLNVPNDFSTIQAAINAAVDGDIVIVEPNTYTGDGNRDIDFNGLAITVRSTDPDDPDIVAATIIDCNGIPGDPGIPHRGFYFNSGEGPDSVLSGVTITNAYASLGGAIHCDADATIRNCVMTGNSSYGGGGIYTGSYRSPIIINCLFSINSAFDGGGIYNEIYSTPSITNCTFSGNSANHSGGGIFNRQANPNIANCDFIANSAGDDGGGMDSDFLCNPTVTNCIFNKNSAGDDGGGMGGRPGTITNCIFSNNSASGRGGGTCYFSKKMTNCTLYGNTADEGGGIYVNRSGLTLTNNIIWGNSDSGGMDESAQIDNDEIPIINYCNIQSWSGVLGGTGNIAADPYFVDPSNGDYHLKSQAGRWYPSKYAALDPTGDNFIDLSDFSALASSWQKQGLALPADLNNSGTVDMSDLAVLLNNYLMSYLPQGWVTDNFTSPCIDAGDPATDWTAELWPHGKRINMGAFGGTPQASMSLSVAGNIADLNNDDSANLRDFSIFGTKWQEENILLTEDLSRDGIVNIEDLVIFCNNWMWTE